jgi:hypothetical protein
MFEEDRAPVTLTETHQHSASCQRSIELADRCRNTFKLLLPFEHYGDIVLTDDSTSIRDYSVRRHLGTSDNYWLTEPDAHGWFERTVLSNI